MHRTQGRIILLYLYQELAFFFETLHTRAFRKIDTTIFKKHVLQNSHHKAFPVMS